MTDIKGIYAEYKGGGDTKQFLTQLQSVKPKNIMDEILRGDVDNIVFEYSDSENSMASRKSSTVDDFINDAKYSEDGDSDFINDEVKSEDDDEKFDFFGNKSDNEQFDEEEDVNSDFVKSVGSNKRLASNILFASDKKEEEEDVNDEDENYINASNDLTKIYEIYNI